METIGQTINRNLAAHVERVLQSEKLSYRESLGQQELSEMFLDCCRRVCTDFRVDDANRGVLNELFLYAIGRSRKLDPCKGIWIYGSVGTGKSTLLKLLRAFDRLISGEDASGRANGGFRIVAASTLANQFARDGIDGISAFCCSHIPCALDEVGREPLPVRYYGTEVNVVQYILQMRYEQRSYSKTYATTNMTPAEIPLRYGDYIADRVNEMFNVIELRGESRR